MSYNRVLLFVLIIVLAGCHKGQNESLATAKFTTSHYNYFLNQDVLFKNLSENATTYKWDFGDGQTSAYANPIHSYKLGGVYNIVLTTNNSNTYTKSIKIFAGYSCYIFRNNTSYPFSNIMVYSVSTDSLSTLIKSYDSLAGGALTDSIFVSSPTIKVLYEANSSSFYSSVLLPVTQNTFANWDLY